MGTSAAWPDPLSNRPEEPEARPRGLSLHILVAEDDADTAASTLALLRYWGFRARALRSGPEALQAAVVEYPDVIFLDLAIPGMDGFTVARKVLAQAPISQRKTTRSSSIS